MAQIPIFVINLDAAQARLARIDADLRALGLHFERMPAVLGAALSEREQQAVCPDRFVWYHRRSLTDAEIGCFLSHRAVLERVVREGIPRACVLEDDAAFAEDFPLWVDAATPLPDGAHIVKLQGTTAARTKPAVPLLAHGAHTLAFNPKPSMGTVAYLVTLEGARRALAKLTVMRDAYDHAVLEYWNSGLNVYEVCPFPARQGEVDSHLEDDRQEARSWKQSTPKTPGHRLRRRLREAAILIRKLGFWISRLGWRAFYRVRLPN